MTISKITKHAFLAVFIAVMAISGHTFAQEAADNVDTPVDILPAATAQERGITYDSSAHTHPTMKLTPDKSELVRLNEAAGSIIIGNPNHLSILADTSKTLVVVPRLPGATHFTILDKQGRVLMQRHVIVGSPKEKYLRVRKSCARSDDDDCQQTNVFYCPDMCHEIILGEPGNESSNAGADASEETATNTADTPSSPPGDTDTE